MCPKNMTRLGTTEGRDAGVGAGHLRRLHQGAVRPVVLRGTLRELCVCSPAGRISGRRATAGHSVAVPCRRSYLVYGANGVVKGRWWSGRNLHHRNPKTRFGAGQTTIDQDIFSISRRKAR